MTRSHLALFPLLLLGLARAAEAEDIELARVDPPGLGAPPAKIEAPTPAPAPDLEIVLGQLPPGALATPGRPGDDADAFRVEYTTDPELDADVRAILARGEIALGQVIAMDPDSGEVLSYVATDPAAFPAARAYPTASLMKVVTAAAVLRNAPEATERTCRYRGSPYEVGEEQLVAPPDGGQVDTFEDALAISNNQCFARLAVHDLGREELLAEIERVGMLAPPAGGLPAGSLDPVDDELGLGRLGCGLAGSRLSPLAALRLAGALVRGELVSPRWIARVRDADGDLVELPESEAPAQIWPRELADALRGSLRSVTERGTARRAFRDEAGEPLLGAIAVAGKTGTLRGDDPEGLYQWFIGVAPADHPSVAIATLVVHDLAARGPVTSAAQVAAATLRALFCDGEDCRGERLAKLRADARTRDAETAALLTAQRIERAQALAAAQAVEPARLIESEDLAFPRSLRRRKVEGEIVLLVSVAPSGDVSAVAVDESDLPRFDEVVSEQVRSWRFSPRTRGGRAEASQVKLRIPIRIE